MPRHRFNRAGNQIACFNIKAYHPLILEPNTQPALRVLENNKVLRSQGFRSPRFLHTNGCSVLDHGIGDCKRG